MYVLYLKRVQQMKLLKTFKLTNKDLITTLSFIMLSNYYNTSVNPLFVM